MRVDTGKRTLDFAINNSAFKNLATIKKLNLPYYLAVAAFYGDDKIALTRYTGSSTPTDDTKSEDHDVS